MEKIILEQKKILSQRLLQFELNGLVQYGKYLVEQSENSDNKKYQKQYKNYIKKQIVVNDNKIKKVEEVLRAKGYY